MVVAFGFNQADSKSPQGEESFSFGSVTTWLSVPERLVLMTAESSQQEESNPAESVRDGPSLAFQWRPQRLEWKPGLQTPGPGCPARSSVTALLRTPSRPLWVKEEGPAGDCDPAD